MTVLPPGPSHLTAAHSTLAAELKAAARDLGFSLAGIASTCEADTFAIYQQWLADGFAGQMSYLERHAAARQHASSVLPDVRSVLMVGMCYGAAAPQAPPHDGPHGRIARYAAGEDYHEMLRARLKQLLAWLQRREPAAQGRAVVDTAPLLERDFARRAGLGWFGKNTMLIHPKLGSYFLLAALLLNLELPGEEPFDTRHCGTCTRCLDACPTQAFPRPGTLDARRCISYLTIELQADIPESLREGLGDWVFGCDVCQEVCPWNRRAPSAGDPALGPTRAGHYASLLDWLSLTEEQFRARFRGTPLFRTKRRAVLRNVALVLGNVGDRRGLAPLQAALHDPEPLIREAARWAIERIKQRLGPDR